MRMIKPTSLGVGLAKVACVKHSALGLGAGRVGTLRNRCRANAGGRPSQLWSAHFVNSSVVGLEGQDVSPFPLWGHCILGEILSPCPGGDRG